MNAVLTQDGQIEIPRELREQLGFQPGNVLELQNQAGTLVAWKKVEPDVFEKWRGRGALPAGANTDIALAPLPQADGQIKNRPVVLLRRLPPFGDFLVCGTSTQLHQPFGSALGSLLESVKSGN